MTAAAAAAEEPILCRLDRIDNMVKRLEEIRLGGGGGGGGNNNNGSPRSSCGSTPSSGTLTSDGGRGSFTDFSPKSLEKHCRPIDDVMMETEHKGTLLQRLVHVEDRVLKLSLEMEQELMMEKKKREEEMMKMRATITTTNAADEEQQQQHNNQNQKKKKGFKQLVKSCVTGGGRRKT